MSLLTPLYIAGLLAVSLPILFHMIRRKPQGRVPFSTLMFLVPTPPRITRRSRIENWLLLLLRAAALCLLALAFARPFLRSEAATPTPERPGERIAVLIDTSASMRRDGLWEQALDEARRVVRAAEAADHVGIFAFDRGVRAVVSFDEWSGLERPALRRQLAEERLASLRHGWGETQTGEALVAAAALIQEQSGRTEVPHGQSIVLVSDLQTGSNLTALHSYEWPIDIGVDVRRVAPDKPTNAGLQLVERRPDDEEGVRRVRVVNAADSQREQFRLRWDTPARGRSGAAVDVYVAPGQSRDVLAPPLPAGTEPLQLVLEGDDHAFDNAVFVDAQDKEILRVVYVGDDRPDDPDRLRYYVERALIPTGRRSIEVVSHSSDGLLPIATLERPTLVVAATVPDADQQRALRSYVERGGTLLSVIEPAADRSEPRFLPDGTPFEVREADVRGYAMLAQIDFTHPLFAPFNEAQFSDFTGIHFWKHRQIDAGSLESSRVLARFDDGAPAILEIRAGKGTQLVFTAGWHPADSQFARSSKFPTLLNRLLERAAGDFDQSTSLAVGEALSGPAGDDVLPVAYTVQLPDERTFDIAAGEKFRQTELPGVYTVLAPQHKRRVAVNVAASESLTAPMPLEKLESLGLPVQTERTRIAEQVREQRDRQLQVAELEDRQRLWRWLIVAGIGLLLLETWLAARQSQPAPA